MKYLRNRIKDNSQRSYRASADHNYKTYETPGYVSHQDPTAQRFDNIQNPALVKPTSAYGNQHPTEDRIESLLNAIKRKRFTHYVKGGFSRSRHTYLTPLQVARTHQLNLNDCLFEIKDARIEEAVMREGLTVVTSGSYRVDTTRGYTRQSFECSPV